MKTKLKTFLILIVALPTITSCSLGGGTTHPASTTTAASPATAIHRMDVNVHAIPTKPTEVGWGV